MKTKLSVLVLICMTLSLLCGCAHEVPEFLPGEHEGEYGPLKGYFEGEDGFVCFYSAYYKGSVRTHFGEPQIWNEKIYIHLINNNHG